MPISRSSIYALKLDFKMDEVLFSQIVKSLTYERQRKVNNFRKREDAIRCIFADLLAKYAIQQFHGCTLDQITIEIGDHGKPIASYPNNVHFNVSHAGIWVVCIVDEQPVGIDVEQIQVVDLEIARDFFMKEEYDFIIDSTDIEGQYRRFFQIWTMKECYVKAIGEGLNKSLQSFSVHYYEQNQPIIHDYSLKQPYPWQYEQWMLPDEYILSAASQTKSKPIIFLEKEKVLFQIRDFIE
ncbi:4'-phosphopantetheinyl transferase superfamily protein [Gottfriedia acidiceleris]|uniref:4'-phosphopantetheinyl transferase family protein n=1 Tax=Gottfriedia acidiceleris TaxID=371036 RepID=UPI002F2615B2